MTWVKVLAAEAARVRALIEGGKARAAKAPSERELLLEKLDNLWSFIVRRRQVALGGETCAICGKRGIAVGYHIVPKQLGYGVRWLIENGCGACSPCNWGEHKNRALYRKKHLRIFGRERVEKIEERGGPTKLSMANLREVLAWLTRIEDGPPGATELPEAPACLRPKA